MPVYINSTGITVDGIPLNTLAIAAESKTGRLTVAPARGSNSQVAKRSGSIWVPNKESEDGVFVIPMWVLGCDDNGVVPGGSSAAKEFYKNKDKLQRLFAKRYALLDVRATQPDGSVRQALAEVTAAIGFSMMNADDAKVTVEFTIPSVYWQDVSTSDFYSAAGMASGTVVVDNVHSGGSAPINDALIMVRAATICSNPRVTDVITGNYVEYSGSVPAGDDWLIDSANFKSRKGTVVGFSADAGANAIATTSHIGGYGLLNLHPDTNGDISLKFSATGGTAQVSVRARRKYHS